MSRYRAPRAIITDIGTQLKSNQIQEWGKNMQIQMPYAPVAHPQFKGQVKVTNWIIKECLKKRLDDTKECWVKKLPSVLWDYEITMRGLTSETSYSLVWHLCLTPHQSICSHHKKSTLWCTIKWNGAGSSTWPRWELRKGARLWLVTLEQRVNMVHNSKARPKAIKVGGLVFLKLELAG